MVSSSRKKRKDSVNLVPIADRLVWARVMRPLLPIVYLDLNHFINLSKASIDPDTSPRGYPEFLKAATCAVAEKRAIFPLSSVHIFELSAINDPRQRKGIADVMERLSQFNYLLGRPDIARLEINAGISDVLGEPPELIPIPLIGHSFGWAFGMRGGLKIVDANGEDATDSTRQEMGTEKYELLMQLMNYSLERSMLDGPSDDEIPILRENGYNPEAAKEGQVSRLSFELDLSAKLVDNPKWRQGRLRDVISGREIDHEWREAIDEVNKQRFESGRTPFDPTVEELRRFFSAMPHTQVAISMKTRYHRNPAHRSMPLS